MKRSPQARAEAALEAAADLAAAGDVQAALRHADAAWRDAHGALPRDHPASLALARAAGLFAAESGHLDIAARWVEVFEQLLDEEDPRRAYALTDRAHLSLAAGDAEAAEAHLTAAVETLDGLVDEPGVAVAAPLTALATLAAARPGGLPDAQRHTARALDVLIEGEGELSPRVADTLLFSALLDLRAGNSRGAAALAARAAEIYDHGEAEPARRALARHLRAEGLEASGRVEAAQRLRAEARSLDPSPSYEGELDRLREDLSGRR